MCVCVSHSVPKSFDVFRLGFLLLFDVWFPLVGKDFGRSAVVCVSHSVPKSFTLSFHDRLDAVETSRGLEYDSEVSNQRRRF